MRIGSLSLIALIMVLSASQASAQQYRYYQPRAVAIGHAVPIAHPVQIARPAPIVRFVQPQQGQRIVIERRVTTYYRSAALPAPIYQNRQAPQRYVAPPVPRSFANIHAGEAIFQRAIAVWNSNSYASADIGAISRYAAVNLYQESSGAAGFFNLRFPNGNGRLVEIDCNTYRSLAADIGSGDANRIRQAVAAIEQTGASQYVPVY